MGSHVRTKKTRASNINRTSHSNKRFADGVSNILAVLFTHARYLQKRTAKLRRNLETKQIAKFDSFIQKLKKALVTKKTYEQKKENFFAMVQSMKPGLHEMIFHPSFETEGLKKITNSWQQRVWEAKMFADPTVKNFLKGQGVQFTNWKEIMKRFNGAK